MQKEWTRDEIIKIDSIKKIIPNNVKFNEIYDQFLYDPSNIPFSFKNMLSCCPQPWIAINIANMSVKILMFLIII